MRDWSQVGGVRLDQDSVIGNCTDGVIPCPVPERDDTAEGDVPAGVQRDPRQVDATGVAVQHADDVFPARLAHHRHRVLISVSCVDDDGTGISLRQFELHRERTPLLIARRIVIVIIETAFANRDCAGIEKTFERRYILARVE